MADDIVEDGQYDKLDDVIETPGIDTLLKAFVRNVKETPHLNWMGTRHGQCYEWTTWKQACEIAVHFSYGIKDLGMVPETRADGKSWRFLGIQSKNRVEWTLAHLANMHQKVTTVAFYDTLGDEAQRFIINQTKLTSICISIDLVPKMTKLK